MNTNSQIKIAMHALFCFVGLDINSKCAKQVSATKRHPESTIDPGKEFYSLDGYDIAGFVAVVSFLETGSYIVVISGWPGTQFCSPCRP